MPAPSRTTDYPFRAQAFGLRWASDCPLPLFAPAPDDGRAADVQVKRVERVPWRLGGDVFNNGEIFADGVRFAFGEARFDMIDGRLVRWSAPTGDAVPFAFFGTITGLLLAWRGLAPLHGSAVKVGERTVLIAGAGGAGKSTLCHALVERGGRLVSDDLSVLLPMPAGDMPQLAPGRTGIRMVDPARPDDRDAKWIAAVPMVAPDPPVRLTDLLLLTPHAIAPGPVGAAQALAAQQFRPRWMRALPGATARVALLARAAQHLSLATLPPATDVPHLTPAERAETVIALIGAHA